MRRFLKINHKIKVCSFFVLILVATLSGCGGGSSKRNESPIIYTAGSYKDDSGKRIACYWKGTNCVPLPGNEAEAKSIEVFNGIVYTVGSYNNGEKNRACLWIGTNRKDLETNTDIACNAEDITISPGGTVFIAGSYYDTLKEVNTVCYWKVNGEVTERINLSVLEGKRESSAYSIAVSGDIVYMAGNYRDDALNYTGCYWKGEKRTDLADKTYIESIFISGEDIYVSGSNNGFPCYWKNGRPIDLALKENCKSGRARSITVFNGTVYTAGIYYDSSNEINSCYWTGTNRTELTEDLEINSYGEVHSITVGVDGIVYIAGYILRPDWNIYPCYWKGSTRFDLPGNAGKVYSITTSRY